MREQDTAKDVKYEFTGETLEWESRTLRRIRRIKDGKDGGWIEGQYNLSHQGSCWIHKEAKVFDSAVVRDDAQVYNQAQIYDHAIVEKNVKLFQDVQVYGYAFISGNVRIWDRVQVYDNATVDDRAFLCHDVKVFGQAAISGKSRLADEVQVSDFATVYGNATAQEKSKLHGKAVLFGNTHMCGKAVASTVVKHVCASFLNITITDNYLIVNNVGIPIGYYLENLSHVFDELFEEPERNQLCHNLILPLLGRKDLLSLV